MNKKIRFSLLSLLVMLCGTVFADAYKVDFNSTIATSNHDFAVAPGWGHIVGSGNYDGYGPYYMSYSYSAEGGVDGTGALSANRQYAGDYGGGTVCYDLLVTPEVNGTVTLDVKASVSASNSNNAFVEVYAINNDGTRGDLLKTIKEDIAGYNTGSNTAWGTVTLAELTEGQQLGLRLQYVYVDNFTATSAVIPEVKSISVAKVANDEGYSGNQGTTTKFEQQADGNMLVKLQVTLQNTGTVALTAGMDNYSLTPAWATYSSGTKTYVETATVAISEDLAVGETKTLDVEFTVPYESGTNGYLDWFVRENMSGTTSSTYRYAQSIAYEPVFLFRAVGSTASASLTTAQAFGLISEATTKQYELCNEGAAPMKIKSITLPAGFTTNVVVPAEGLTIAKFQKDTIDITLPVTETGSFSGNLQIVYLDKDETEQTYTLALSGTVLAAGTWVATFDNTTSKLVYPAGAIAQNGISSSYSYISSENYNNWIQGRTSSSYAAENNMFITPKLHATAGAKLAFDVKGTYDYSGNYYAKVYVSTDRQNWGAPVAFYTYGEKEGAEAIGYTDWVNKSITFDAEGDYYVAFALYGEFKIDNIVGLTKVDVAHDLFIKSVSWPDAEVKSGTALTKPSIDIIPLTTEAAENYTVKYVCGETVLAEGTPVELTASNESSSSKTISFSWTPTVESTTTYENTKIVIAFTDGPTFESETFTLKVTNDPKFHFVNSIPTSKWYEPTDRSEAISFGKTNTADTLTFYVYNWGSAALTVNSISLPEGFTTTVEFPQTVPAFDENDLSASALALPIAFSATAPGIYSGDMVITHTTDSTFTLAVNGTKLDPAKFYANFDNATENVCNWPAGSVYQQNVSGTSSTYSAPYSFYIGSSSTVNNIFVTPKLTATAGEKLQFDAKLYSAYWSEGAVKVYAAATREEVLDTAATSTRTLLFNKSGEDVDGLTSDYQTFEITFEEAGDYYIGFEMSNRPAVDEIYGLTPAAVAHDWMVASTNIPAEAMQNVATTATVNILNVGVAEEAADSYTVTAYVDGEAVATGEAVAIPMNHKLNDAGTQLSVSFRTPKVGTFPVYVEVKAGDYSVVSDTVDVTFAEEIAVADAIQVGTKSGSSYTNAPLDFYNLDGGAKSGDIVYTAAMLNAYGITNGAKITKLAFKGTISSAKTIANSLTAWVGLKTGDITWNTPDKTAMTEVKIYDGEMAFAAGENEIAIDLSASPIIYDGTSDLRVYLEGTKGGWAKLEFDYDNNYSNMYWSNGMSAKYVPLLYVTLPAESATLTGTVKDTASVAIEGATVTLVSADADNVQYTATTGADGAYTMNVVQVNRKYIATATIADYTTAISDTISFAEGSQTQDFVIRPLTLTEKYLVNPDFEGEYTVYSNPNSDRAIYQPEGWTIAYTNGDENDMTSLNSSCLQWNQFSGKPQPAEGGNNTYWTRFRWGNSESLTLSQTVTLPAGDYKLTADAFFKGANGGSATINAAGVSKTIEGNSTWANYAVKFTVAEEGPVTLGFNLTQTAQVENIAGFDNFKLDVCDFLADAKADLQAEITVAEALLADESNANGRDDFQAAITTAKDALEATDVAAVETATENLKTAVENFKYANIVIPEGKYYLVAMELEDNNLMAAGMNWGTQGIVNGQGIDLNFIYNKTSEKYTIETNIYYGNNHFLGNNLFMDSPAFEWSVEEDAVYGHCIYAMIDGVKKYIAVATDGRLALSETAYAWAFMKAEWWENNVKTEGLEAMKAATAENGVDATFLLKDANFNRGDHRWAAWTVSDDCTNKNLGGGCGDNNGNGCAESYHSTFTISQIAEGAPAGIYTLTAQGFYRQDDGVTEDAPVFFLNDSTAILPVKTGEENSMTNASYSFSEGKYAIEPIKVAINAGESLNVGVKGTAAHQWVIFDNFKLTYYGAAPAEPLELTIDAERYTGMGYTASTATVDFAEAMQFLGVESIKTEMIRIQNPDGTLISDYAPYDGWFDGNGVATQWGDNTKICVKFFQAVDNNGTFEICDMNGADVLDTTYTVKWALVANDKQVTYAINVKFVKAPEQKPEIIKTIDIAATAKSALAYEGATATFDPTEVATALGLASIADATQYIVNVTDSTFVINSTDGWRNASGDAAAWGTGEGMVCVKISDPASGTIDYIGAIDDSYAEGATYTAKWGFVNAENKAVVLNVNITFTVLTGIAVVNGDTISGTVYNLRGQKVEKIQRKGFYIVNGKKVVIK